MCALFTQYREGFSVNDFQVSTTLMGVPPEGEQQQTVLSTLRNAYLHQVGRLQRLIQALEE
jgi:hypothetical protein